MTKVSQSGRKTGLQSRFKAFSLSQKVGVVFIAMSCFHWPVIFGVIPFLSLSVATKAVAATCVLAAGETLFWAGALLVGQTFVRRYRKRFMLGYWQRWWRRRR